MNKKQNIILFILITYGVTLLLIRSKSELVNALSQAVPALVALLLILFSKLRLKEFASLGLFNLSKLRWYVVAITLPIAAIGFSYLTATFIGYFSLDLKLSWPALMYRTLLFTFMWPLIWSIGEEIGWRGFLQPKLSELLGLRKGILLTGIAWAVWHYIFIFSGGYYEEGNPLINTVLFTITVVLMSFSMGWIRYVSQSVWPCVLFHSASNAAWQMFSYQFKIVNPDYIYISGEAGILNILFWGVFAFVIWNKLRAIS